LVQLLFAGLTSVTDKQTDHATQSVTIGCIYIRSTAMQPNNTNTNNNIYGAVIKARPLREFTRFI